MRWHPLGELRPQHRVGKCLGIEQLLQAVQPLVTARVLVERLSHTGMLSRCETPGIRHSRTAELTARPLRRRSRVRTGAIRRA